MIRCPAWLADLPVALMPMAVALGSAAAWAASGRFTVWRAFGALTVCVSMQVLARRNQPIWAWALLLLGVPVGWLGAGAYLAWRMLGPLAIFGLLAGARAAVSTVSFEKSAVAAMLAIAHVLLILAIAFGQMPVWCLLALLMLPRATALGWTLIRGGDDARLGAQMTEHLVVFCGQVVVGYLIAGLVR